MAPRKLPRKGILIPKVGMADALFSRTQRRVLGLLFGQPDREYGMAELIKLAQSGSGAVQRELERLVTSGLVSCSSDARHKRYRANSASPIFGELQSIVGKTAGVADVVVPSFRSSRRYRSPCCTVPSRRKSTEH